jgi:hypothetical protein
VKSLLTRPQKATPTNLQIGGRRTHHKPSTRMQSEKPFHKADMYVSRCPAIRPGPGPTTYRSGLIIYFCALPFGIAYFPPSLPRSCFVPPPSFSSPPLRPDQHATKANTSTISPSSKRLHSCPSFLSHAVQPMTSILGRTYNKKVTLARLSLPRLAARQRNRKIKGGRKQAFQIPMLACSSPPNCPLSRRGAIETKETEIHKDRKRKSFVL